MSRFGALLLAAVLTLSPTLSDAHHFGGGVGGTGGGGGGGGGGGPTLVWRGNSTHTLPLVQFDGTANWSECSRTIHYSTADFSQIQVDYPTFYIGNSTPIQDIDLPNSYNYQASIEYPVTKANSGIPARTQHLLFSGSQTGSYTPTSGPFGAISTDNLMLAQTIPAGQPYALWQCIVNAAGSGSASGTMPEGVVVGSYEGATYETTTLATTDLIASDWVDTATTITAASKFETFGPILIRTYVASTAKVAAIVGDSIAFGVGDGGPGYNVAVTNLAGDSGWPEKYIHGRLGYAYCNFSKGSDGFKYLYVQTNQKYRLAELTRCNPTDILVQNGHNDVTQGSLSAMVSHEQTTVGYYRSAVPGARIIGSTVIPSSTSTDWWVTNQTAAANFGGTSSVAGQYNALVRSLDSSVGFDGYIDAAAPLTQGATDSGLVLLPPPTTTLSASMDNVQTSLTLTGLVGFPSYAAYNNNTQAFYFLKVDSEFMQVSGGQGSVNLTVARGSVDGTSTATTPASHSSGSTVYLGKAYWIDGVHPNTLGANTIAAGIATADPF